MSEPSNPLLKPIPIAAVGLLILVAAVVGLVRSGESPDESGDEANGKRGIRISKSDRSGTGSSREENDSGPRKSDGKSDEEMKGTGKPPATIAKAQRRAKMLEVSIRARNELKQIRTKYATQYDSVEARRAFSAKMKNVTDPEERRRLLDEHSATVRAARIRQEAEKGFPERAREKRLGALQVVQNLHRMIEHVGKNPGLAGDASAMDDRLAEFVANKEKMGETEFHASFAALQADLQALRDRNDKHSRLSATPSAQGARPAPISNPVPKTPTP